MIHYGTMRQFIRKNIQIFIHSYTLFEELEIKEVHSKSTPLSFDILKKDARAISKFDNVSILNYMLDLRDFLMKLKGID